MRQVNAPGPFAALLLPAILALALAACSPQEPPRPSDPPAPASAADSTPVAAAPAADTLETQVVAGDAATVPEVSEVDEQQETVEEAPTAAGTLNLRDLAPLAAAQAQTPGSRFQQGVNYNPLVPAQPTSVSPGQVEAVEVFWYGCSHCFALDPFLEDWRKNGKAANVTFVRVPAMWNDTLKMHARAYYVAEALGKLEELHPLIFREIQVNKNPLNTIERIGAFFREHGVSAEDFQKAATSFAVESKLRRAEELNRRYKVQGVPLMVVNGKWTADVATAGGQKELVQLVNELAAREKT